MRNTNIPATTGARWQYALLAFVVLLYTFQPLALRFTFGGIYLRYAIGLGTSLLVVPAFYKTRSFFLLLAYIAVMFLNFLFDDSNLGNILSEGFNIMMAASLAYYVLHYDVTHKFSKILIYIFFAITAAYTIQTLAFYSAMPGVMRFAAMESNAEDAYPLFRAGLSPYSFPHAIACVMPAYILGLKNRQLSFKVKVICVIMLTLSVILVYITQATGATLIALFAVVISLIFKRGQIYRNVQLILLLSIFLIPFTASKSVQLLLIDGVENVVSEDSKYMPKIEEIRSNIVNENEAEGDINYRGDLLGLTLSAIVRNPILGTSFDNYGHHNALLDRWADYGLIGFLPLVMFIFYQIKQTIRKIPVNTQVFYLLGVSANILMMLNKSMFGWYQWLAFLVMLPVLTNYYSKNLK